jgi:hypothetical protein
MLRNAAPERVEDARERAEGAAPQHEGRRGWCRRWTKNQPAGVENGRGGGVPVSGLFFTGSCATAAGSADTGIEMGRRLALMLRDASQRGSAAEAISLASRCDPPQHEGRRGRCGGRSEPARWGGRKGRAGVERGVIFGINRNLQAAVQRERVRRRMAALVIAGLDPAIHLLRKKFLRRVMDPRVKPAGDGSIPRASSRRCS